MTPYASTGFESRRRATVPGPTHRTDPSDDGTGGPPTLCSVTVRPGARGTDRPGLDGSEAGRRSRGANIHTASFVNSVGRIGCVVGSFGEAVVGDPPVHRRDSAMLDSDVGVREGHVAPRHLQRRVANDLLEGEDISAGHEEPRSERVPEEVRVKLRKPCPRPESPEEHFHRVRSESTTIVVEEHGVATLAGVRQVFAETPRGPKADGHDAFLLTLAEDFQPAVIQVQVRPAQPGEFGQAKACVKEQHENRPVADGKGRRYLHHAEEKLDIVVR